MDVIASSDATLADWRDAALTFEREVGKVVLGQERVIRLLTIAVFARGHVLLEGDVGVGKTTLLKAMARAIGGAYARVEGTIDLMPTDLVYDARIADDGRPRIDPGPLLKQGGDLSIFFFNEINRARPQVHALLLRLMAEGTVSAFGREVHFPHLQVFADRNRIEREETFELPAAARDRFFMEVQVTTPADREARRALIFDPRFHDTDRLVGAVREGLFDHQRLADIARLIQERIHASPAISDYTIALWDAVRAPHKAGITLPDVRMDRLVQGGASPRGLSFLVRAARVRAWLEGRDMIVPEDLRAVFPEVMAHRIFFDPVYEMRRDALAGALCRAAFETVPAP
ncbi:AAA family ATPase [Xanthobacter agilis]|uniref:MoxR-like ATPase n=1 Tax=Xanthobacter agilis TaxID=47492 RepID=A0ABU0LAB3_XANAG|nr:MoxR family ATPase [Xanthobacter agilis]MDQ0504080.1 MoxR-like ATPase [Xanthobacter agilis]